jgi:hypothetical protein
MKKTSQAIRRLSATKPSHVKENTADYFFKIADKKWPNAFLL